MITAGNGNLRLSDNQPTGLTITITIDIAADPVEMYTTAGERSRRA